MRFQVGQIIKFAPTHNNPDYYLILNIKNGKMQTKMLAPIDSEYMGEIDNWEIDMWTHYKPLTQDELIEFKAKYL